MPRITPIRTVLAAAALLALAGCKSRSAFSDLTPPDRSAEMREAMNLTIQGDRLMKDGDHLAAAEKYKAAIRVRSDCGEAWNNLGLALLQDRNFYDAQQAFVRAGDALPLDSRPMENLGALYLKCDLPEDALRYYEMALERKSASLPALRGAVRSSQLISRSDETTLKWIKKGLLIETDPEWRNVFQSQMTRVQQDLSDERRNKPLNLPRTEQPRSSSAGEVVDRPLGE